MNELNFLQVIFASPVIDQVFCKFENIVLSSGKNSLKFLFITPLVHELFFQKNPPKLNFHTWLLENVEKNLEMNFVVNSYNCLLLVLTNQGVSDSCGDKSF